MRGIFSLAGLVLLQGLAVAAAPEKLYYLGEVKLSSQNGQALGSQVVLVERTLDRDKATISEEALVVQQGGKVEAHTARLAVKDNNTYTLTGASNKVEGGGTFFGPPWNWTYMKGTFKTAKGAVIEDENFMADNLVGSARKKVILPNNQGVVYMDMSLRIITPRTFEILRAALTKK